MNWGVNATVWKVHYFLVWYRMAPSDFEKSDNNTSSVVEIELEELKIYDCDNNIDDVNNDNLNDDLEEVEETIPKHQSLIEMIMLVIRYEECYIEFNGS